MAKEQKAVSSSTASRAKADVVRVKPVAAAKPKAQVKPNTAVKARMNRLPVEQNGKSVVRKPQAQVAKNKPVVMKAQSNEDKSEAAKKQDSKGKKKLTKKQIGIICGVAAVLVVAIVVALVMVFSRKPVQVDLDEEETAETTQDVDYDQKITAEDGGTFKAEYQAGSEKSFAVRFADLKCEDECKNVSEVKLGKKVLKLDEDYEVKKGSIIIILTEGFMKSLKVGKHDLVIAVVDGDETKLYGVKFTVKAEPTCEEGETLEKGECVKKEEEESEEEKESDKESEQSSQADAPVKSQAQIDCESKDGPTGFLAVHWTADDEYVDTYMTGTISMHRVNGVCRPNVAQASGLTGRGFGSTGQPVSEGTDPTISSNQGQDFIMWFWSDGATTTDKVTNALSVWSY